MHARAKCCGAACGGVLVRFGREYLLRVIRPQRWSGPRGTAVDAGDAGSREKYDDSEGVLELIRDGLSRVKAGRLSLIRSSLSSVYHSHSFCRSLYRYATYWSESDLDILRRYRQCHQDRHLVMNPVSRAVLSTSNSKLGIIS